MKKFILVILLLTATAYFIWPTPYIEYPVGQGPYAKQVWPLKSRVNRLTRDVSVLSSTGDWKMIEVERPELLRPDITGVPWRHQPDASAGQQKQREIQVTQAQADRMARAATDARGR